MFTHSAGISACNKDDRLFCATVQCWFQTYIITCSIAISTSMITYSVAKSACEKDRILGFGIGFGACDKGGRWEKALQPFCMMEICTITCNAAISACDKTIILDI